jgi:hypothetical protein
MMEDQVPEREIAEAQANKAEMQEFSQNYAVIVLFCHPRNVTNLVEAFEQQIEHAAGALPLDILWSGHSGLLQMGVVMLEWEGIVSQDFVQNLHIDQEIFDYVVCPLTGDVDEEEQAGNTQGRKNEIEGGQLL